MAKNIALGVISLAIATIYIREAWLIPRTTLSDSVGPSGLPLILGWALVGIGVILIAQAIWNRAIPRPAQVSSSPIITDPVRSALKAFGIVAIATGFLLILRIVGYLASVAFLVLALSLYLGIRPSWRVGVVSALGAMVLWAIFVWILGIRLPAGFWPHLMG